MKKRIICCLILSVFTLMPTVKADIKATLQEEYLKEVYYSLRYDDGTIHTHQEAKFTMDGKTVYCLDSRKDALTGEYNIIYGIPENILNLETQKKVEKYGYYGYDYPGHQTINYYIATQELIWEATDAVEVTWYTRNYENGEQINVENEKKEILNLISKNEIKPSFIETNIIAPNTEEIVLTDNNLVLSNYQAVGATIKDNQLMIPKSETTGPQTIQLIKNRYDYETTIIYQKEGSQTLSFLRLSSDVNLQYTLERTGGIIQIKKEGEIPSLKDNKYDYENIPLSNIEFEIYAKEDIKGYQNIMYQKDELVMTLITDEKGKTASPLLPLGNYYIKEKTILDDYYPNKTKYELTTKNNQIKEITIQNEWKKANLKIYKIGPKKEAVTNTEFKLYNNQGIFVSKIITNEEGIATFQNLPYGNYILKEIKTDPAYQIINTPINITVEQDNTEIKIQNDLKKGNIKLFKKGEQGEIITNTEFELYDSNGTIISKMSTNEEGIIVFQNLPYGNYKLKEIKTDPAYELKTNLIDITVNQDVNEITVVNQKKIELPNTSSKKEKGNILIYLIPLFTLYILWKKH